jgi:multidrug efflux pump subunit AcrA (membrane-fusion protein)
MLHKTENSTQIGGQTLPLNDVRQTRRPLNKWLSVTMAFILVAAVFISGVWSRVSARKTLNAETAQVALTAVSVVTPQRTAPTEEIVLPGNVQPFITSPIYARTSGYQEMDCRHWMRT